MTENAVVVVERIKRQMRDSDNVVVVMVVCEPLV